MGTEASQDVPLVMDPPEEWFDAHQAQMHASVRGCAHTPQHV